MKKNKLPKVLVAKIKVMSPPPKNWIVGIGDPNTLDFTSSKLLTEREAEEYARILKELFKEAK